MIYAGQEFGEEGMDEEGFSGKDGRTTIFDYWCVDSIYKGYYNRTKLTQEQKQLEQTYQAILQCSNQEEAISKGKSFDLMYANMGSDKIDSNKIFAFIRKYKDSVLLVVANFSDSEKAIELNVPQHAFDYLEIKEQEVLAEDLLSKEEISIAFKAEKPIPLTVKGNYGRILKLK